jgi:hypothetical protein
MQSESHFVVQPSPSPSTPVPVDLQLLLIYIPGDSNIIIIIKVIYFLSLASDR